jgi:hypothetical protein
MGRWQTQGNIGNLNFVNIVLDWKSFHNTSSLCHLALWWAWCYMQTQGNVGKWKKKEGDKVPRFSFFIEATYRVWNIIVVFWVFLPTSLASLTWWGCGIITTDISWWGTLRYWDWQGYAGFWVPRRWVCTETNLESSLHLTMWLST